VLKGRHAATRDELGRAAGTPAKGELMRNLLAFLAAVCVTVAVSGWYLGWYTVDTPPAPQGKRNVNIEINTVKIGQDIQRGSEKLQDLLKDSRDHGRAAEKTKPDSGKEGRVGVHDDGGAELSEHAGK
jgi:hypothetical protein